MQAYDSTLCYNTQQRISAWLLKKTAILIEVYSAAVQTTVQVFMQRKEGGNERHNRDETKKSYMQQSKFTIKCGINYRKFRIQIIHGTQIECLNIFYFWIVTEKFAASLGDSYPHCTPEVWCSVSNSTRKNNSYLNFMIKF